MVPAMLEKLTTTNFRRLKRHVIKFHKRVTYITGPNDVGKSSILSALRWVCLNRPIGKEHIRHGAKRAKVVLRIDGRNITRGTGTSNFYKFGSRPPYEAVGTDVPERIRTFTKIDAINFQRQRQALFWFDLTPGQVAKELNSLVDLEAIDKVQATLAKEIRDKQAELRVSKERLSAVSAECRRLRWVRHFDVALSRLETLYSRYATQSHRIDSLASALKQATIAEHERQAIAMSQPIAHRTARAGRQLRRANRAYDRLRAVCGGLRRSERAIIAKPIPHFDKPAVRALALQSQANELSELITSTNRKNKELCKCEMKLERTKLKLEKSLGGRCPSCGTILSDQTLI